MGGEGGGKWGERGREVGIWYPPVHPSGMTTVLLGKGLLLCSLVCAVFLCFCHFPTGSGVLLDCIDS